MLNSTEKADLIAKARGVGSMYVTQASPGENDSPEKTLFEAASSTSGELLAAYKKKMDSFDTLPLDVSGEKIRLYAGEWSIWSGFPGTGKSTLLRQTACHLLKSGKSVFVATLEADPSDFLIEIAATAFGVQMPSEKQLSDFIELYGERLKIWAKIGMADHRSMLSTIRGLVSNGGISHAIIDSLMALDIDSSDYEAQRKFANLLSDTARSTGVHLHLCAHPRKPISADQEPNIWDVAGASDLGRLAFNVFFIRRGPAQPGNEDISGTEFHVLKQRTRGTIGCVNGYFYKNHRQFHVDPYAQQPHKYMKPSDYPATGLTEEIPEHIVARTKFVDFGDPHDTPWDV